MPLGALVLFLLCGFKKGRIGKSTRARLCEGGWSPLEIVAKPHTESVHDDATVVVAVPLNRTPTTDEVAFIIGQLSVLAGPPEVYPAPASFRIVTAAGTDLKALLDGLRVALEKLSIEEGMRFVGALMTHAALEAQIDDWWSTRTLPQEKLNVPSDYQHRHPGFPLYPSKVPRPRRLVDPPSWRIARGPVGVAQRPTVRRLDGTDHLCVPLDGRPPKRWLSAFQAAYREPATLRDGWVLFVPLDPGEENLDRVTDDVLDAITFANRTTQWDKD